MEVKEGPVELGSEEGDGEVPGARVGEGSRWERQGELQEGKTLLYF